MIKTCTLGLKHGIELCSLRDRPRKSIKNKSESSTAIGGILPILTIWIFGDFALNDIDHDFITDKTTCIHNFHCRSSQCSLLSNLSTKHIYSCKMRDTILILDIK